MEAITALETPVEDLTELDFEEREIPLAGKFYPCAQCGHHAYMHFDYMNDWLSYCKNHGERHQEKLTELGAPLSFDFRNELYEENRLVED